MATSSTLSVLLARLSAEVLRILFLSHTKESPPCVLKPLLGSEFIDEDFSFLCSFGILFHYNLAPVLGYLVSGSWPLFAPFLRFCFSVLRVLLVFGFPCK